MNKKTEGIFSYANINEIIKANSEHTEIGLSLKIAKADVKASQLRIQFMVGKQIGFDTCIEGIQIIADDKKQGVYLRNGDRVEFKHDVQALAIEHGQLNDNIEDLIKQEDESVVSLWALIHETFDLASENDKGDKIGWTIDVFKQQVELSGSRSGFNRMMDAIISGR